MVDEDVGSLIVTSKGKVIGIVTERDYLRKVVHAGRTSATTKVSEICTRKLVVASLDDTVQDCVDAMGNKEIRHLPVSDSITKEIIGLLSIRDVARALAQERERAFTMLDDLQTSSTIPIHDG